MEVRQGGELQRTQNTNFMICAKFLPLRGKETRVKGVDPHWEGVDVVVCDGDRRRPSLQPQPQPQTHKQTQKD